MTQADPYGLSRFLDAQEPVFDSVCEELRAGRKASHWMWFIFPQIKGLARSASAVQFAIGSLAEAKAYAAHPVLGARLTCTTELINALQGRSITDILGSPDDLKFRSCMTLFARAWPENGVFTRALDTYCDGKPDPLTLEQISNARAGDSGSRR